MIHKAEIQALVDSLQGILENYAPINSHEPVSLIDAFFAYRLLLGRNPDRALEFPVLAANTQPLGDYLDTLVDSAEFSIQSRFVPGGHQFMVELPDFRFWFDTGDREMGVAMALGAYEGRVVKLLTSMLRPGMTCIDIGAQTGYYTCHMAAGVGESGRVHAFEPMPHNFDLILKNIRENRFDNRVVPHHAAASNTRSELIASRLSNMFVIGHIEGAETVRVEALPVDEVVRESVDIVKVDAEGHEPAVLEGMRSILKRDKPVLFSEINEYWLSTFSNTHSSQYVDQVRAYGYDVFSIDDIVRPLDGDVHVEPTATLDIVAVPHGKRPADFVITGD